MTKYSELDINFSLDSLDCDMVILATKKWQIRKS